MISVSLSTRDAQFHEQLWRLHQTTMRHYVTFTTGAVIKELLTIHCFVRM